MHLVQDYLSLWEVAHRWHDFDPNLTDATCLPLPVQDSLRTLTRALAFSELHVLSPNGITYWNESSIPNMDEFNPSWSASNDLEELKESILSEMPGGESTINGVPVEEFRNQHHDVDTEDSYQAFVERHLKNHWDAIENLERCYEQRLYDKQKLEGIFLDKYELFRFCQKSRIPYPAFWYTKEEIKQLTPSDEPPPLVSRHDKALVQAVAKTLWLTNPNLTIKAIIHHEGVQRHANGRLYSPDKTLRRWISEVDPRPPEKKRGRPKKNDL